VQETLSSAAPATSSISPAGAGADRRVRRAFLVALVAFFGLGGGWALALPINGTYDESEHIVRAYGVASGQIFATAGTQRVPASLLPGQVQCTWQRRLPASCQVPPPADRHRVAVRTGAAAYSPVYYLPVGLPMLVSPGYGGIVAGRLVSALLCALLLAAAVAVAVRLGNRLLVAGLVLVATPMVMNLAGSINPNGLEIAAGALLWCALLALLRPVPGDAAAGGGGRPGARRLVLLAGSAAVLLMTVRHMGPLLLGLVLVAAALLARPGQVRALLRRRDVRWAGAVLVASGVLALVWFVTAGLADVTAVPQRAHPYPVLTTLRLIVAVRVPFYLQQTVGQFSYGETTIPSWTVAGWCAAVATLAVPALLLAGRRYRLVMAGLAAACLGILVVLEFAFIHTAGWVAHSRYVAPAGAGLVLGACFVRRWHAALGPAPARRLVWLAVLVAVPVHLWALAAVMTRFQIGPAGLMDPFGGSWQPAGGPFPALAVETAGLLALAVLAWLATHHPDPPASVPAPRSAPEPQLP
jgi:hypothetical protein